MIRRSSSSGETVSTFVNAEVPNLIHSISSEKVLEVVEFGRMDVFGADILDSRYLILGNSNGLFFVDLTKDIHTPVQIIRDLAFQQLAVLEDYSVLIAVSGRHSHIRQYRLSSIRKLIRYLSGTKADRLANLDLSYLSDDIDQTDSLDRQDTVDDFYQSVHNVKKHDEGELVMHWRADYVKVVGTRDSKSFVVQRTFSTVFLACLVKQDVILYQWASEPYSQFLKLKAFWLPEKPKFLKLIHDGISVNQICIGYQAEANLIKIDDSTVKDIQTHRAFREKVSINWKSRWSDFSQIPFSKTKAEEVKQLALNQATVNRKLLAATTLKRPSHHNIETYFLATFDRLTLVTDISVSPLIGKGVAGWKDGVSWEAPIRQLILRHGEYVVGITKSSIQVNDWTSSACNHKINFPADGKIQVLSDRAGGLIIKLEQKRKRPFIYWLKEKAPPKIYRKEDIIKAVKAISPFQNKLEDLENSKKQTSTPTSKPTATYAAVARERAPNNNVSINGGTEPLLKSVPIGQPQNNQGPMMDTASAVSKQQRGLESNITSGISSNSQYERRTYSRKNVPTLSTDEYIRMRNQFAAASHQGQAILTRPIINAYNQPYSQHSYSRPRPPATYYGNRNASGFQVSRPPLEPEMYSRRAHPAGPHQMQAMRPVVVGGPPPWVLQRPETAQPYQNDQPHHLGTQPYAAPSGMPFYSNQVPYMHLNHPLRPPMPSDEYGIIQQNSMMRSNPNPYAPQSVYAPVAPQRQQYGTPTAGNLTTPERRQSLSLSNSVEDTFESIRISMENSNDDGDQSNSEK